MANPRIDEPSREPLHLPAYLLRDEDLLYARQEALRLRELETAEAIWVELNRRDKERVLRSLGA